MKNLRSSLADYTKAAIAAEGSLANAREQDEQPIKDAIAALSSTNESIRQNSVIRALRDHHRHASSKWHELDLKCAATLERKKKMVEDAKFPLPALSVSDDAVLFAGIPLKQASSSQQIQVSAAIGIALNPTLRCMFIREGSLLDRDSLQSLLDMADAHDVQLMIERVSKGEEVSVVIGDGAVADNRIST